MPHNFRGYFFAATCISEKLLSLHVGYDVFMQTNYLIWT